MTLIPVDPVSEEEGYESSVYEVKPGIYTEDLSETERRKKFTPSEDELELVRGDCGSYLD